MAFAFFTALLHAIIPFELGVSVLQATLGTVLQLLHDLPASMVGTCPCAHPCLPGPVRACCNCLSLATLGLQCCLGVNGRVQWPCQGKSEHSHAAAPTPPAQGCAAPHRAELSICDFAHLATADPRRPPLGCLRTKPLLRRP